MVAIMEQKNPPMEEKSSKDRKHNEIDEKQKQQPLLGFQRQIQHHHRFLPLMHDNIYNCELCGVRIAVLQIVNNTANDQEQFKVCGTCLKEYIDQEAAK
jgi:superfamily II helicase